GACATWVVDWRVDTVAGDGIGRFNGDIGIATSVSLYYPNSIAFDGAGYIYIADGYNNCIRRVNLVTKQLNTYAGLCIPNPIPPNILPYQEGPIPAAMARMYGPWGLTFDNQNPPNL